MFADKYDSERSAISNDDSLLSHAQPVPASRSHPN